MKKGPLEARSFGGRVAGNEILWEAGANDNSIFMLISVRSSLRKWQHKPLLKEWPALPRIVRVIVERASGNHLDLRVPWQIPTRLQSTYRASKTPHEFRRVDDEKTRDGFLRIVCESSCVAVQAKSPKRRLSYTCDKQNMK